MKTNDLRVFRDAKRTDNNGPFSGLTERTADLLDTLFQILLSVTGGWGFIHLFTSAYGLTVYEGRFLFAALYLSVMFTFLLKRATWSLYMLVASAAFLVIYTAVTWQHAVAECSGIYAKAITAFYDYYGWGAVKTIAEPETNVTWIMILFSLIPIWQTVYAYGKHVYPTILTFFFMMPLFLDILGGTSPSMLSVTVSAFTVLSMFFTCRAECSFEEQEVPLLMRRKIRFMHLSSAAVLTAVLMALSGFVVYPAVKENAERFEERYSKDYFKDLLAGIGKNPFNISKNGLSEGNLLRAGNVVRNGKTVLKVTFGDYAFEPVYLRGFAADTYTKNAWKISGTLTDESYAAHISYGDLYVGDTSSALYRNPYLYYQSSMAASIYHAMDSVNAVVVEKLQKDRYAYQPYSVHGEIEGSVEGLSFTEDLFLRNRDTSGALMFPYYEYATIGNVMDLISANAGENGKKQPDGTTVVSIKTRKELYDILKEQYGIGQTYEAFSASAYSEYTAVNASGTEIHYRIKEDCLTAYEESVIESCLQVPEGHAVFALADELCAEYGSLLYNDGDPSDPNIENCVKAVQKYLAQNMVYSLNPGTVKNGTDFAEDFLLNKKKGYCVHFATAGTLILRALGVPARYVEGYLVPSSSVKKTQELTDYDAHAWAEVFIEGFGWYPVEFTNIAAPEEEETEESTEESTPPPLTETAAPSETETKVTEAETSAEVSEKTEENELPEEESFGKRTLKMLLSGLVIVLLAAAAVTFMLYLKYHIRPLEKLTGADRNETCLKIYRMIVKQAERSHRTFTVDDSAEEIGKLWPEIPEDELARMQTIVKAAFYSNRELSEECVHFLYGLYSGKQFARDRKEPEE